MIVKRVFFQVYQEEENGGAPPPSAPSWGQGGGVTLLLVAGWARGASGSLILPLLTGGVAPQCAKGRIWQVRIRNSTMILRIMLILK